MNVAQLEGHSALNSVPHFLVLKGGLLLFSDSKWLDWTELLYADLRPFHSYIMTLAEAPRYLASLRAVWVLVSPASPF